MTMKNLLFTKIFPTAFFVLMLLVAVPAHAQKVAVAYDREVDFSRFKTYSWFSGVPARNPLIDQRIVAIIADQLDARGLKRAEGEGDLQVAYYAVVSKEWQMAAQDQLYAPGWLFTGPVGGTSNAWQIQVGTLVVKLKDGSTKKEVWRASASETVSNDSSKDVSKDVSGATKKVKKIAEKMFKDFPPTRISP